MARSVSEIRRSIENNVRAEDPSFDVKHGPIQKTIINPIVPEIEYVEGEVDHLTRLLSINYYEEMSDEELDAFALSFATARGLGTRASGYVVFYSYELPSIDVIIPRGFQVSTSNGYYYYRVVQETIFTKSSLSSYLVGSRRRYEFPVAVEAVAPGDEYNVSPLTINTMRGSIAGISGVANLGYMRKGLPPATNEDIAERLSARLFSGSDIIGGRLAEIANSLEGIVSYQMVFSNDVGEFKRLVYDPAIDFVVLDKNRTLYSESYTASGGEVEIILEKQPVYSVVLVEIDDVAQTEGTDYSFSKDMSDDTHGSASAKDKITFFSPLTSGQTVRIVYNYYSSIEEAQEYMEKNVSPYFGTNVLVRLPFRPVVNVSVRYRTLSSYSQSSTKESVIAAVKSFFYPSRFIENANPKTFRQHCAENVYGLSDETIDLIRFSREDQDVTDVADISFNAYEYPQVKFYIDGYLIEDLEESWVTEEVDATDYAALI